MITKWNSDPDDQMPFLSFGFRPFFLVAGVYAALVMMAWIAWLALHNANAVILSPTIAVAPHLWHAHEMLLGFTAAVITGFMLTAVPGWTGARRVAGLPLAVLLTAWVAGRLVIWFSAFLPAVLVAAIDMLHLPLLAGTVAIGLIKRPAPRNVIFLGLLLILIIANGAVHAEWMQLTDDTASWGLAVAMITTILLIVILGGRVVPAFTRNAMIRRGDKNGYPRSSGLLDKASIASTALVLACYILVLPDWITGTTAGLAAVTNLARWALWRWQSVLHDPIVWSLHLAYVWIPIGMAATSVALLGNWLSHGAALHILAIGAVGGMTLAMMTRAPLGHTGRQLVVIWPVAATYLMIAAAAILRSFGLELLPDYYFPVIFMAGGLWISAFVIFVVVYAPILTGPSLKQHIAD